MTVAGMAQDTTTYDAIGRDIGDATPLGQFNTTYLGETDQVSTVTALGQSISGSPGLTTYGYLPNTGDRRLNTITFNAAPTSNETITTDDADRVNCRTDGTSKIEAYAYDQADRLSSGTVASACAGGTTSYTETYGLNNADFINAKSGETTAANNWAATNPGAVNAIGTLTPSGGTGRTYTYDANGNVLADGIRTYTWDAENRLLTITENASGHVSNFTYDGLGRRVAITETTGTTPTTTGYLWCGTTICAAYNTGGTTIARYQTQGEVQYASGAATPYYYERDHLGTPVSMTAATGTGGTPTNTLATDAYGLTLTPPTTGTIPTFGYVGMFMHQASGLYLTKYRAYDPYSGRWLSRDPTGEGGGTNLFAYVTDNPINEIDRWGLQGGDGYHCGQKPPPPPSCHDLNDQAFGGTAVGVGAGIAAVAVPEVAFPLALLGGAAGLLGAGDALDSANGNCRQ